MRPNPAKTKQALLLDMMSKNFRRAFGAGRFEEALAIALKAATMMGNRPEPWADAAVCSLWLKRWDDVLTYAQKALGLGGGSLPLYDALANAWGEKGNAAQTRHWGMKALTARDELFGTRPKLDWRAAAVPPAPSAETRNRNIIALSLFGGSSKYCETAILNAIEQPRVYPNWMCRVYVDGSVPTEVVQRLRAHGAAVVPIDDSLARWPGQMWRFAAYDMEGLHRVIFRDADSVISPREARAVDEWVASNKRFHMMRDFHSHTELLLAGLWGATSGSLPPMRSMVDEFLERPLASRHFADQYFLREYVWPYARQSLLQHDSVFGFLDGRPFPDAPVEKQFHVGCNGSAPYFEATTPNLPDNTMVRWQLRVSGPEGEQVVCSYPGVVSGGKVRDHLPSRYLERLDADMRVVIVSD